MPQQTDNDPRFLLVDESVLPEVFAKVVEAKDLLRSGRASTAAQAAGWPAFPARRFTSIGTRCSATTPEKAGESLRFT